MSQNRNVRDNIIIEIDAVPANHVVNTDELSKRKEWNIPFNHHVTLETIGTILMAILIALSNAGGLSGAGSNIPIMLIFFNMDMAQAVPVSAFVAVCATTFRFILNFNQTHPKNNDRNIINYEIVSVAMPAVFLGSFFGVMIGKLVGELVQVIVFGITVAWSIKTTTVKACDLIKKEKQ